MERQFDNYLEYLKESEEKFTDISASLLEGSKASQDRNGQRINFRLATVINGDGSWTKFGLSTTSREVPGIDMDNGQMFSRIYRQNNIRVLDRDGDPQDYPLPEVYTDYCDDGDVEGALSAAELNPEEFNKKIQQVRDFMFQLQILENYADISPASK